MSIRLLFALLLVLALAPCLGACGGGGSSGSSTTASSANSPSSPSTASTTSSTANTPPATAKPKTSSSAAKTAAERRTAGRAAPFVKPQADNSIPTFGSEAGASDRSGAEAALRAYLSARAKGDWSTACAGLATALRQQTQALAGASAKAKGCAAIYKALAAGTPAAARADPLSGPVLSLRVKGASAFALFNDPHNQQYVMPMTLEGGAWKVTQLAPIAYPLGSEAQTSP
jgi:hypothetical protein